MTPPVARLVGDGPITTASPEITSLERWKGWQASNKTLPQNSVVFSIYCLGWKGWKGILNIGKKIRQQPIQFIPSGDKQKFSKLSNTGDKPCQPFQPRQRFVINRIIWWQGFYGPCQPFLKAARTCLCLHRACRTKALALRYDTLPRQSYHAHHNHHPNEFSYRRHAQNECGPL